MRDESQLGRESVGLWVSERGISTGRKTGSDRLRNLLGTFPLFSLMRVRPVQPDRIFPSAGKILVMLPSRKVPIPHGKEDR
jgi:hypothetical protein